MLLRTTTPLGLARQAAAVDLQPSRLYYHAGRQLAVHSTSTTSKTPRPLSAHRERPTYVHCAASPTPLRQLHTTSPRQAIEPVYLSDPGEGIAEVELIKWHVNEGASISEFDPLCEVQSDKASVEITSRHEGVVASLKWKVGQIVKVGDVLCHIEKSSGGEAAQVQEQTQSHEEHSASQPASTSTPQESTSANALPATASPSTPQAPEHLRSLAVHEPPYSRKCLAQC